MYSSSHFRGKGGRVENLRMNEKKKDRAKDLFDLVESFGTQERAKDTSAIFSSLTRYYEKKKNEQ